MTSFIQKDQYINLLTVKPQKTYMKKLIMLKTVMVDLYADWCVACKELEKYTFSDDKVSKILNDLKLIKFDITKTTEDHSKFIQDMKVFGPPAIFFMIKMV